jgi:hypothetical protein
MTAVPSFFAVPRRTITTCTACTTYTAVAAATATAAALRWAAGRTSPPSDIRT